MNFKTLIFSAASAVALVACGEATTTEEASAAPEIAASESAVVETAPETVASEPAAPAEAVVSDAITGVYTPDYKHRYIVFSYDHQNYSNPLIRWDDWTGELNWNAEAPEQSSVSVTINAASASSGVEEFDGHLSGDRLFNAAQFPEITFVSTAVEKTGANTGKITGDLTIKGVTKPVVLDVTFRKGAYDERGSQYKLGFSAKTTVMRSDYGVDFLVPVVGDAVDVVIETEWALPAPAAE